MTEEQDTIYLTKSQAAALEDIGRHPPGFIEDYAQWVQASAAPHATTDGRRPDSDWHGTH